MNDSIVRIRKVDTWKSYDEAITSEYIQICVVVFSLLDEESPQRFIRLLNSSKKKYI